MNLPVKLDPPQVAATATSRSTLLILFGGACIAAAALAVLLGPSRPEAEVAGSPAASAGTAALQAAVMQPDAVGMVQRLSSRLADGSGSAQDWALLGRSTAALGRHDEADAAYRQAIRRAPADPALLTEAAEALLERRDPAGAARAEIWLAQAREADPSHLPAWLVSGNAAFARGDVDSALQAWSRALRLAPAGSPLATTLARSLQALHAPTAAATDVRLRGTVQLAPALASQVRPQDTVYVFARPAGGAGLPVGIIRLEARALPAAFDLELLPRTAADGDPARWTVMARVARGGDALPQPGDLIGQSAPALANDRSLTVTIDTVQR